MECEKRRKKEHDRMNRKGYHKGHYRRRDDGRSGELQGEQARHQRRGRHGGGYLVLAEPEGTQLLFVGSRSCSRHKGTEKQQLRREGKLSFLCLDEVDWISGGYLDMITQAAEEIIQERKPQHLIIFGGCQIELLSTDYNSITKELSDRHRIDVQFHKGCHLIGYGKDLKE